MNRLAVFGVFILVLVIGFVSDASAQTDFERIRDLQVEIRHANIERVHFFLSSTADGMLQYIESVNGDTSKMSDYREEFAGIKGELLSADTHIDLNAKLVESGEIVQSFKEAYDAEFEANGGKPGVAGLAILKVLNDNKGEMEELTENYWEIQEKNVMEIYDIHLENMYDYISWFESAGYDVSELEEKGKEIEAKKDELRAAIQDRKPLVVLGIHTEIHQLVRELGQIAADLLRS